MQQSELKGRVIRVGIVEDNEAFRQGVGYMIESTEGFELVGKYESLELAMGLMPECDVILMDIHLPGKSGIEGITEMKARFPAAQIVMMTVFDDESHISKSIIAGASGYILKRTAPARLIQAIQDAADGGMPMSPAVAKKISQLYVQFAPEEHTGVDLTPREKEILSLLVDGLNFTMIAEKLFISFETVRNHTRKIYDKLHVHSKSEAVSKAIKQGLI
ncbi:MAG: response regulator transcription factor [Chloroherpetonaceae bacterium]|nr:response regulator transcription factor [Chloroherpetonaceae bacterium]